MPASILGVHVFLDQAKMPPPSMVPAFWVPALLTRSLTKQPATPCRPNLPLLQQRYEVQVFMIRPWPAEDDHYSEEAFADDETFQRVLRSADQVGGLMTLGLLPIRSDKHPSPGSLSFSGITSVFIIIAGGSVRGYYCRPAPPARTLIHAPPLVLFFLVDAYEPGGVYSWCAYRTTWPRARPPFEDSNWTSWSSRSWGLTLSPTSCRSRDWLRCRQEKATRIYFRVLSCLLFSWTFVVERCIGYWYSASQPVAVIYARRSDAGCRFAFLR